ncbi:MAG: hypothetical protein ACRD3P_05810 [Terriglobales bacterium]
MGAIVRMCAVLALSAPMLAWSAQTGIAANNKPFRPAYDASREITVTGNVKGISVHSKSPSGAHLLITTSQGLIDVHLGKFALRGSQPLSVQPGEQVSVVGVMTWVDGSQILLARTVSIGTKSFVIRNQHGAVVFPHPTGKVRFKIVNREGKQQ